MKKQFLAILLVMASVISLHGQKSAGFSYNYQAGNPVTYRHTGNVHEVLDVNGQTMDVYVKNILRCRIESSGKQGADLKLDITVDSLTEAMDTPQGAMGGFISEATGKKFTIVINPAGKVKDLSGAKNTTYVVPGQGQSNFSSLFGGFFPGLPEGKAETGHTWTSVDTLATDAGTVSQLTITKSENRIEGFEQVEGYKCARIASVVTGTSEMKNEVQGMNMITKGTVNGNVVSWFSPEAGYFIKNASEIRLKGNIEMPNEGYSFPVVLDISDKTIVVK